MAASTSSTAGSMVAFNLMDEEEVLIGAKAVAAEMAARAVIVRIMISKVDFARNVLRINDNQLVSSPVHLYSHLTWM